MQTTRILLNYENINSAMTLQRIDFIFVINKTPIITLYNEPIDFMYCAPKQSVKLNIQRLFK